MRFHPFLRTLALGLTVQMMVAPVAAIASSHSEAPGTSKDRLIDDTDLYAWVASDAPDMVTIVGNWVPLIEPNSGPNFASFDDAADYYINIDNVGDARHHIRFEFEFKTTRVNGGTFLYNTGVVNSLGDATLNVRQTYTVTRFADDVPCVLARNVPVAPNNVGPASMPHYSDLAQSAIRTLDGGGKVWAGPRDDPFFVDLAAIFDLLTIRSLPGDHGGGIDGLKGFNCMTIALQLPKSALTRDGKAPGAGNSIIGIWDSAERPRLRVLKSNGRVENEGPAVQVSRLGMPLVNEVVIPLRDKDRFNASPPRNDAQFLSYVTQPELPVLLNLLYGISVPPTPRNDLVAVFLTGVPGLNQPAGVRPAEMLRLNMAIAPAATPARLGVLANDVAGFPNGRRLGDDVVDIAERVVAGVLVPGFDISPNNALGDGVDANDVPFLPYFPYVAPPHNPFDHQHDASGAQPVLRVVNDVTQGLRPASPELESTEQDAVDDAEPVVAPTRPGLSFVGGNPSSRALLRYTLAAPARVALRVYDLQGRVVRTLVDQDAAAGSFQTEWDGYGDDGSRAGKGVYFARFTTSGQLVDAKKIVLE
jgi:uncharacterized protein DUF4331/flagellar hook capping protein FlgD